MPAVSESVSVLVSELESGLELEPVSVLVSVLESGLELAPLSVLESVLQSAVELESVSVLESVQHTSRFVRIYHQCTCIFCYANVLCMLLYANHHNALSGMFHRYMCCMKHSDATQKNCPLQDARRKRTQG